MLGHSSWMILDVPWGDGCKTTPGATISPLTLFILDGIVHPRWHPKSS